MLQVLGTCMLIYAAGHIVMIPVMAWSIEILHHDIWHSITARAKHIYLHGASQSFFQIFIRSSPRTNFIAFHFAFFEFFSDLKSRYTKEMLRDQFLLCNSQFISSSKAFNSSANCSSHVAMNSAAVSLKPWMLCRYATCSNRTTRSQLLQALNW